MRLAVLPLIGLLALLGDSCAEDDSCNPIACTSGFEWSGEPEAGVLEPGHYVLNITLDGTSHRATCTVSDSGDELASGCDEPQGRGGSGRSTLDGPHMFITEGGAPAGFAFWAYRGDTGPSYIAVSISRDGNPLGSWTYDDLVYERWPDGSHCGTCYDGHYVQETW